MVCHAEQYRFAVVPKATDSPFFAAINQGCIDAAIKLSNVTCVYLGPENPDVRFQDIIIREMIKEGVDGIAVAIGHDFLSESSLNMAHAANIPLVTFNADLPDDKKHLRSTYVGSDNFALGVKLGQMIKKYRPNGGKLIIQTERMNSPNLDLRIDGLRYELSGKHLSTALHNHNDWTEVRPLYLSYGKPARALKQLNQFLNKKFNADTFVAVGGWAQFDTMAYELAISNHEHEIRSNELTLVFADATESQITLLCKNLAHANIGQDPYQIGYKLINALYRIVERKKTPDTIYTGLQSYDLEGCIL
jgi:ribose transport system substrate-binding protein